MRTETALSVSRLTDCLTEEELDAVTVVFHQYETGLREGTIYTKVCKCGGCLVVVCRQRWRALLRPCQQTRNIDINMEKYKARIRLKDPQAGETSW